MWLDPAPGHGHQVLRALTPSLRATGSTQGDPGLCRGQVLTWAKAMKKSWSCVYFRWCRGCSGPCSRTHFW